MRQSTAGEPARMQELAGYKESSDSLRSRSKSRPAKIQQGR